MKPLILSLLIGCSGLTGWAQLPTVSNPNAGGRVLLPATIFFNDVSGIRKSNEFNQRPIKGTPFFKENWGNCTVRLTDNRVFEKITGRVNLYSNTFHYLSAHDEELEAPADKIREIRFADTTESGTSWHLFANGYPAIDKNTTSTYYEVLQQGKVQLLQFARKKILELKGDVGMPSQDQEFLKLESWYVFRDGKIQELKKDKNALIEYLSDKKEQVESYIQSNRLKCRSIAEIRQVVSYYNIL